MQAPISEASVAHSTHPPPVPELIRLAYSIEEVAAILGLSVSTIRRLIRKGRLRTISGLRTFIEVGRALVEIRDLLQFCERHHLVLPRRAIDFLRKY